MKWIKDIILVGICGITYSYGTYHDREYLINKKLTEVFRDSTLMSKKRTLISKSCTIRECIELIRASTKIDFIIDQNVSGQCGSLYFSDRAVGEILEVICSSNEPRLALRKQRGIWCIVRYDKAYDALNKSWKEEYGQRVFCLKHLRCDDKFKSKLETMWRTITCGNTEPGVYCTVDVDSKKIFIKAPTMHVKELERFLHEIDCIGQQVRIDAIVAIADKNYRYGLGFNWSGIYDRQASIMRGIGLSSVKATAKNFGMNMVTKSQTPYFKLPITFGGPDLNLARVNLELRAAEHAERVKILLKPSVLTSNNETAEILIGKSIPIKTVVEDVVDGKARNVQSVEYKDIGTILNVCPAVSPDNQTVLLDIWVEDSSASGDASADLAPVIKTIRTKNKVLLRSGQTTVIGGLMLNRQESGKAHVPGLSAIPIIGRLFRGTRKVQEDSELLIFITPTII